MLSIRFSKQKSFHSFKTKGVSNFRTAFDLASYNVHRMSRQDSNFCGTVTLHRSCQLLLFTLIFLQNSNRTARCRPPRLTRHRHYRSVLTAYSLNEKKTRYYKRVGLNSFCSVAVERLIEGGEGGGDWRFALLTFVAVGWFQQEVIQSSKRSLLFN